MVNIDHPVIKMFQFNVLLVRLLTSMQSSTMYLPWEDLFNHMRIDYTHAEFTIAVLKSALYGFQGSSSHGISQ